jgi:hypothetical protein
MSATGSTRKFGVQVRVTVNRERVWKWLKRSDGVRYEYDNADKAHETKNLCYPLSTIDEVRVAEIFES